MNKGLVELEKFCFSIACSESFGCRFYVDIRVCRIVAVSSFVIVTLRTVSIIICLDRIVEVRQ